MLGASSPDVVPKPVLTPAHTDTTGGFTVTPKHIRHGTLPCGAASLPWKKPSVLETLAAARHGLITKVLAHLEIRF